MFSATLPEDTVPFDYDGARYSSGMVFESDDACQMLGFAQAFEAANQDGGRADASRGFWEAMERACPAGQAARPASAPASPPVMQDPTRAGGDSAAAQGAPRPQTVPVQGGTSTGPGGGQGESPAPGQEPTRPPSGQADPALSRERPQAQTRGGDPVDLFNGALSLQETDLEIPNTILPLALTRTYSSGIAAFGPFGWNWDHNYDLYVRELTDGNIALWRNLHEDIFRSDGAGFEPPPGIFERLERVPGAPQTFDLNADGGNRLRFERPPGWSDAERIPVTRAEDRHGNTLRFTYGSENQLHEVRDEDDHFLHFQYDACGLLVAVSDQAGRTYTYTHDEATSQLVSATSPPTADQPAGITRIYHYADPFALPELRHNIIRVGDAEGRTYLENRYDEDPASPTFARVLDQLYGAYLYQYRYTQLQYVPADAVYLNEAAIQVEVLNPDFGLETHTFNYRGDLLDRRFRLAKDRSFRVVSVQYEYDAQGNVTTLTRADGSQEVLSYDAANADPRMRGKLLGRELRAATGFPAPSRNVWRARYEPTYQLLVEEEVENGATTTYRYDFDLTPAATGNTGKLKQIIHPDATLPDGSMQPAVVGFEHNPRGQTTAAVLADGSREELQYGTTGNAAGRLSQRTLDAGGLGIINRFEYDGFGFDSTTIDGNGNTTIKRVNALGLLESELLPTVDGTSAEYVLHYDGDRRIVRVERPRGTFSEPGLTGNAVIDRFDRDVLGHPIRSEISANTSERRVFGCCFDFRGFPLRTSNPDGSRVERRYDERGLAIEETVRGRDGASLRIRRDFDLSGRVTRVVQPGGPTTSYAYDGFGRLRTVRAPTGTEIHYVWQDGDVLQSIETVGDDGFGSVRRLEMVSFSYDERLRVTAETVESFVDDPATAVPVTTQYFHDAEDRTMRIVDQRGGVTVMQRDGIGRVVSSIDPVGNEERFAYDGNSNPLRIERHHREPDGTVSVVTTTYEFDARNRQRALVDPDGSRIGFDHDARDLLVGRTDQFGRRKETSYNSFGDRVQEQYLTDGLPITHRWDVDDMSRPVAYIDPTGEESRHTLDSLGRIVSTAYRNGFTTVRVYDQAGNVVQEQLGSGARFDFTFDAANRLVAMTNPAVGGAAAVVADHAFTYDGLNRLASASLGTDQVVRRYDSQGRIVREERSNVAIACSYDDATGDVVRTWPDGRAERHTHDLNGTLTGIEEVTHGVLGAGGTYIGTFTPSGPGHFGEARYAGNVQVAATYDDRKRLVDLTATSPAGLAEGIHYRYDRANTRRIESITGANPQLRYHEFDVKYRLSATHEGFTLPVTPTVTQADHDYAVTAAATASTAATYAEEFQYDAADARLLHRRTGQADRNYVYEPGHRPQTDGFDTFAYSADAVLERDGQFTYDADALGRIIAIRAGGSMVGEIRYDALGRPSEINEPGLGRRILHHLGDHVAQENDGNAPVRQVTFHTASGIPVAYHVTGATHYTLFDGRLNLSGLIDSTGTLLESYRYAAFGDPAVLAPSTVPRPASAHGVEPLFGGQRYLASAGRYLARRRLMDPAHGHYLSPDPLGYEASPSLYAYAAQNPIDLADPEGEFPFLAILVIMAIGAAIGGGLNATRQGIQMAENPRRRQQGFSWGELGQSMGIGAVVAPALVFAPELAVPLAGYGVYGGINQFREGNYFTGAFDIVTSLAPFGLKGVQGATLGRGTAFGQARGLGPMASLSTRAGRFTLVQNNLANFFPSPSSRRIGLGFARDIPQGDTGHVAVIVEREGGGFWFAEKNAAPAPGRPPGSRAKVASFNEAEAPPTTWDANPRIGPLPFEYTTTRVPRGSAAEALSYGQDRLSMNGIEPFDASCANCSHFAGDVLARAGFRGMGNGRAGGLYNDFTNFTSATNMTYSSPFWARIPSEPAAKK